MRAVPAPEGGPHRWWRTVNGPNALTLVRIALVPVFGYLLIASKYSADPASLRWGAVAVFVIAGLTDLIDGDWARRTGQVTAFGKLADPIADKALTGTAFVLLSWLGQVPWWITVVIIAREAAVTVLRVWALRLGVIAASRGGKAKTVLQLAACFFLLMPVSLTWAGTVGTVLLWVALVVTVATGVDYGLRAWRLRSAAAGGSQPSAGHAA